MFIFAISWTAVGRLLPFRKRISRLSFSTPAARWSLTLRRWDFDVTTLDRSDPLLYLEREREREGGLFALCSIAVNSRKRDVSVILKMTLCVSYLFFNFSICYVAWICVKFNSEQRKEGVDFTIKKFFFLFCRGQKFRCETFVIFYLCIATLFLLNFNCSFYRIEI